MIWLTWRQFRAQLVAVYALVAAACVVLAVTGPALARLAHRNTDVYDVLTSNDRLFYNGGLAVLAVAPAVLGIFWGAPLVAREIETGTYRLVWGQSVTRGRWLAAKLGFAALRHGRGRRRCSPPPSPGGPTRSTVPRAADTGACPLE